MNTKITTGDIRLQKTNCIYYLLTGIRYKYAGIFLKKDDTNLYAINIHSTWRNKIYLTLVPYNKVKSSDMIITYIKPLTSAQERKIESLLVQLLCCSNKDLSNQFGDIDNNTLFYDAIDNFPLYIYGKVLVHLKENWNKINPEEILNSNLFKIVAL